MTLRTKRACAWHRGYSGLAAVFAVGFFAIGLAAFVACTYGNISDAGDAWARTKAVLAGTNPTYWSSFGFSAFFSVLFSLRAMYDFETSNQECAMHEMHSIDEPSLEALESDVRRCYVRSRLRIPSPKSGLAP